MTHIVRLASTLLAFVAPITAQWSDNLDGYANNTTLHGVGGWFGWAFNPAAAGKAVNTFSRSAPNSMFCDGGAGTDATVPNLGITSGKWRLTAWQYIPATLSGDVFLIVNNKYTSNYTAPPNTHWATQLKCSGATVGDDLRTGTPQTLVIGAWAEIRVDIDLNANAVANYYNGNLISSGTWTGGWTGGGGPVAIENLDFFSAGGTCYWDDIQLLNIEAPRDIVAFEANADNRLDLATANNGTNDVSLHLNSGTGTFPSETYLPVTLADTGVIALAAGDLDGDGSADDLAVACATSSTVCTIVDPAAVSPMLASLPIPGLANPADVAVAPLNAGATADIVVACEGTLLGNSGGVAVRLDGGAFLTIVGPGARGYVRLAVCDLDGDGDNDIAAISRGVPDRLDMFQNNGSGVFGAAVSIDLSTSGFATGLCCCDIDGDGDNDLVSLIPDPLGPNNGFNVHKNSGTGPFVPGRFTTVGPIPTPGQFAFDVACGDFEQDMIVCGPTIFRSREDVCVVNAALGAPTSHHGFDGAVFTQPTQTRAAGTNPIACVVADLNGDGGDDLAIANQGSGDVTVTLTTPPALADAYGVGCPGTGGVIPAIGASGLPVPGSMTFAVTLAQARTFSPALMLFAAGCNNVPLGGGCMLYVDLPVLASVFTFTNGGGTAVVPFPIPISVPVGLDAYMQWAVFDPNGAYLNTLSVSPGLRIQVGM